MEKKTIGKFISVLRRASGMTQKELGEKLYVSDKTVSRWERDECTPELSLIPAIAEIFGITTDELLRGERNSPAGETTQSQKSRSSKQFKTMLHERSVRFRNRSVISVGVALAAAIMAFVINESFYKGTLAFGIGAVLIVAAFVCQFCFASSALMRLDDEDDTYEKELRRANSKVIIQTAVVLVLILAMFAFILPMGLLGGSYYALSTGGALALGTLFAILMAAVCHVIYVLLVRKKLVRRELIWEEEAEAQITHQRRDLLKRCLRRLLAVLLALGVVLGVLAFAGAEILAGQTDRFTDVDEFCEFMEQGALEAWKEEMLDYYGDEAIIGNICVFLDFGYDNYYDGVLYPPEYNMEQILDNDGNVICEYASEPNFVSRVKYTVDEETGAVQITAYTRKGMREAELRANELCELVLILMVVSVVVGMAVYLWRLRRLRYPRKY